MESELEETIVFKDIVEASRCDFAAVEVVFVPVPSLNLSYRRSVTLCF